MTDATKLRLTIVFSLFLLTTIILYNIFQDYFETQIISYIKRRIYYEQVISKKELSRHKARYWRKLNE